MNDDVVVYYHPDHPDEYVAAFSDAWFRWPAEKRGWTQRRRIPEPDPGDLIELEPANARLALLLSGGDR